MPIELWLGFVGASALLLVAPGQIVLYTIHVVLAQGRSALPALALGAVLGDGLAMAVSLAGVGVLLASIPRALVGLKFVAGCVLVALGIIAFRAASRPQLRAHGKMKLRPGVGAFALTAFHPMGLVFFAAFIPAFVDHTRPLLPQVLLFGVTFLVLTLTNILGWGIAAAAARRALTESRRQQMGRLSASIMVAIGVYFAAAAFRALVHSP
ncbi:MAG: LysE family transporter [Pseudomonadota bacterium]